MQTLNIPKIPQPPTFASIEDERRHRKQHLAAAFRLFARFGFDEGIAVISPPVTPNTWITFGSILLGCTSVSSESAT
jgi:hypothetical protein